MSLLAQVVFGLTTFVSFPSIAASAMGLSLHVTRTVPTGTTVPMKAEGTETFYNVEKSALVGMRDFIRASVTFTEGQYCLNVTLTPQAAATLRDYTTQHVGEYLGFVVDGSLAQVAKIFDPLEGDGFLVGGLGEKRARELARRINEQKVENERPVQTRIESKNKRNRPLEPSGTTGKRSSD
jgi:preprotein translocase subunit SecD